ncbi:endonuclease/Exonuclease/phosphatase family isoform X2 [Zea mays]|uniref:endonuclease/Exonuclease/phosphatase family isoform X2 n=1 Tax=Zea mays TaxID=4577 RepID=UPI0004DEA7B6|nr:endonuclease/Exonuclease/phosphatase family isoform X2 [Zea mays]|eukprot:XP_008646247.1 endonuclease/Exonuclease/phosphatase family isoform X2 [Zea mays]
MPSPSRSPTTPPVASEWSCVRCTLLNPDHSDSCVACEASRPVEVDIDSPVVVGAALALASPKRSRRKNERSASPPPQRFGRKREHDASPEVVELCDIAGKGPATKKGNLEICLDKKTFKIMTYNVWFREDLELRSRMDALGDLIKQHCPDFICFQLSKMPTKPSDCIPFSNSTMGRELCIASVRTGEITKLILATTHLESPCPAPPKWDQMYSKERVAQAKQSLEILGGFPNAILCGDMNWDDKGDGPFPLQDGWTDAWVELKPGEDGWTYDTKANGMLSGNRKLQKRLDRFVCKLADFKMDSIEMIGKEAIPGVSYFKEKKIRKENQRIELPVFPSDHFGLVLTITQQKDDNV